MCDNQYWNTIFQCKKNHSLMTLGQHPVATSCSFRSNAEHFFSSKAFPASLNVETPGVSLITRMAPHSFTNILRNQLSWFSIFEIPQTLRGSRSVYMSGTSRKSVSYTHLTLPTILRVSI